MIGIYGGTFDPVHFGHLRTALDVKEHFSLDKLLLVPCRQPAHRESPLTTPQMRSDMLQLAACGQTGLVIDRRELDRKGVSYMIDTLKSIRTEVSADTPLLLFIGADAYKGLKSWHQWQMLFDYAHIIVMTRPGYEQQPTQSVFLDSKITENKTTLQQKQSGCLFFQPVIQLDISSTIIRNKIKLGLNPAFLLPKNVIQYIQQQKLYL